VTTKSIKTKSKLLSLLLRHDPGKAGLTLGENGWVSVESLLVGIASISAPISRNELDLIVTTNDKQRFSFSEDRKSIRAAQGHSIKIDLALKAMQPPNILFHGTAEKSINAIMQEGLKSQSRRHVHLSVDIKTATRVAQRHGKPIILSLDTVAMVDEGIDFFQADNGVWLTYEVEPRFLTKLC